MPLFTLRSARLLALAGLATACAPTYQLGLKPAQPTGLFTEGREQAQAVADSVEVRLSFVCYEPNRVVFEAEYRNPTRHALVVDPAAFQYEASRHARARARPQSPAPQAPARHRSNGRRGRRQHGPAAAAAAAQRRACLRPRARNNLPARHAPTRKPTKPPASTGWGWPWARPAWPPTWPASAAAKPLAQFQSRAAIHDAAVTYNVISAATKVGHAVAAEVLQQRAAQLQEYALRKVTLEPGQQVRGYLYFPRYDAADALVVQAPVGSRVVPLEFAQVRAPAVS